MLGVRLLYIQVAARSLAKTSARPHNRAKRENGQNESRGKGAHADPLLYAVSRRQRLFLSRFRLSFLPDRAAAIVHQSHDEAVKNEKVLLQLIAKMGWVLRSSHIKENRGKSFPIEQRTNKEKIPV